MLFEEYDDGYEEDFIEDSQEPKRFRVNFLKLAAIAVFATVGTTFAANVNLGGSGQVEFGQGAQMTTSCDPEIQTTPIATFRNDSATPMYIFNGIKLKGVSAACRDKLFIVRAYGETGTALNVNANFPRTHLKFHFNNSSWLLDVQGCYTTSLGITGQADDNQVTVKDDACTTSPYWKSWYASAGGMYRYTIETRDNTVKTVQVNYTKGDGRTFGYVNDTGEEGASNGHITNFSNTTFLLDTLKTKYFSIYFEITQSEFNTGNSAANLFNVSATNGSTCTFSGVVNVGTPSSAPGVNTGYYWNTIKSAEYVCEIKANSTITVS